MLHLIETTTGLIIFTILYILIVWIPLFLLLRKMLKPEHIEIENGKIKEKDLTIFYNLALQKPIYVKLVVLFLIFAFVVSILMFYGGLETEDYEEFFALCITICYILLIIQLIEERKTLFYGFLPIIKVFVFFWKILSILLLPLKKILEFVMYVFFILPFKLIIKFLESK